MKRDRSILLFLPHLDVVGGLGVHCRMLLTALNRVKFQHTFTVVSPTEPGKLFTNVAPEPFERSSVDAARFSFRTVDVSDGFSLAGELDALLKPILNDVKPDLLYCSYYTGMREPGVPQIVTFHDAGFLENPSVFGPVAVARRQTLDAMRPMLNCIHCISADARDRICQKLPWDKNKTAVVWHALPESTDELKAAMAIPPNNLRIGTRTIADLMPYFFLPVGAATGFNRIRKNVPTAIAAFRMHLARTARMIVAGTATLTEQVLAELLPKNEVGQIVDDCWWAEDERVVIVPTMERLDFLAAMSRAVAVVYPSRYEGFGLPALEAMALGVPLIASLATSIPEIVGDAALLVPPDDTTGFANAMQQVLHDGQVRNTLIRNGQQRIGLFTMAALGQAMGQLFEKTIHST